jgi:tetratricopeptide (TPR) repeat protein
MTPLRVGLAAAGLVLAIWIGWTLVQATRADLLAEDDPQAALRLDPDHPQALLRLAWRQLGQGDNDAATATARHLLAVEPGQGDAFAVLALAAARRGDADASALARIALQRAPRNRDLRATEAAALLKAGDLDGALAQIDALLRLTPTRGKMLYPALAQQAQDKRFAEALAATLAKDPPWRRAFLGVLNKEGTPAALDQVYAWLQQHGELTKDETGRWLDRMIADGRWGEAYAHWVGTLGPDAARLTPVYNGDFERDPSRQGFGWRNDASPGAFAEIEAGAGPKGNRAAHVHFIGRPAARGNLRQALLLAPGRFDLAMQVRTDFLRSDQGLQWVVRCDKGRTIAVLPIEDGSDGWRRMAAQFEVPAEKCAGQWLELRNPAVSGSAQQVSGDLWIDDVAITPHGA